MIKLAPGLELPLDAITQTFGILAVRGAGKSNLAAVMAEEMHRAGLPFVVVDPVGSWWGLRSSSDGKGGGLGIPIFGGRHGDVPLERTGGQVLADLVVDDRVFCVLDISEFSEGDKTRFLIDFAERLYRRNTEPLHLFLEEADDYAPQRPMREQARLLRAWENVVRRGRSRGLGITLITQRSAALNKNVLTQIETLCVLRTTSPQDRKAIEAWVEYHGQKRELLESLPGLAAGEAWIWSPQWLGVMKRVQICRRSTFDSASTPKHVKGARPAATLADVDLGKVRKQMAATIERAKQEDPRELRRRIAELERQVAAKPDAKVETKVVERAVVKPSDWNDAHKMIDRAEKLLDRQEAIAVNLRGSIERLTMVMMAAMDRPAPRPEPPKPANSVPIARAIPSRPRPGNGADLSLSTSERAFLTVLARRSGRSTARNQLAVLSGYSAKSSHVDNKVSSLRTKGLVDGGRNDLVITPAGEAALGELEPLPTGAGLVAYWVNELGAAPGAMLQKLVSIFPRTMSRDELAEATGYSGSSSHVDNTISALRTRELLVGPRGALRASEDLFE